MRNRLVIGSSMIFTEEAQSFNSIIRNTKNTIEPNNFLILFRVGMEETDTKDTLAFNIFD